MKLFYSPGACALGLQIVLREAGYNFDLIKVNLATKESPLGNFLDVNPKGYVPALELNNGDIMTENAVMLQWIADQNADKKLLPAYGTKERYQAMEWLNFVSTELHKGIGSLFNKKFDDNAKAAVKETLSVRLSFLDSHLKSNKFVLGSNFSVIDPYLYNVLRWCKTTNIDLTPYKGIMALMETVASRPTTQQSLEAEGLSA